MWPILKTQRQTIHIYRNGHIFQCDPENPFARFGCGGSAPKATPADTLIPSQKSFVNQVLGPGGMVAPQVGQGFEGFQGQRYAPMDPFYTDAAKGAIGNMSGSLEQFAQPAMDLFKSQISPYVMNKFSAFGGAASGGAAQNLAQTGAETIMGQAFNPWMQANMAMPGNARNASDLDVQRREQPLQDAMSRWSESQPYNNPYLKLGQQFIPAGGQYMENLAEPGQQGFMESAAPGMASGLTMAMMGI